MAISTIINHLASLPATTNYRALFAWLISRTFSANEQYFSISTNQPTVLSAMVYQPSEQGKDMGKIGIAA